VAKIQISDFERDLKFEREKNLSLQRQLQDVQDEFEKVSIVFNAKHSQMHT
jgi:hypothetical protein